MTYLRGQDAHVIETVRLYMLDRLTNLGWFAAVGSLPFGAQFPLTLIDYIPEQTGQVVAQNTVAFTDGHTGDDEEFELGAASGGLFVTETVLFFDVYGETQGIALRIANDIKAILTGKLPGCRRYQYLRDFTFNPAGVITDSLIHFENVTRERPQAADYKRHWQVVKATVHCEFNTSEYGGAVSGLAPAQGAASLASTSTLQVT